MNRRSLFLCAALLPSFGKGAKAQASPPDAVAVAADSVGSATILTPDSRRHVVTTAVEIAIGVVLTEGSSVFGGRAWAVLEVRHDDRRVVVAPAPVVVVPRGRVCPLGFAWRYGRCRPI